MRYRVEQLSEEIVRLANETLVRSELPGGMLLTVVGCELSGDTREAVLVVSVLPEQFQGTGLRVMRTLLPSIRKRVASLLSLKHIPLFSVKLYSEGEHTDGVVTNGV